MMATLRINKDRPFGLFEIDESGTIIYSKVEPDESPGPAVDVTGKNFFQDVVPLETVVELKEKIASFTCGNIATDSFYVTYRVDSGDVPVKVLLGRIRERPSGYNTKSVLVHIRRA